MEVLSGPFLVTITACQTKGDAGVTSQPQRLNPPLVDSRNWAHCRRPAHLYDDIRGGWRERQHNLVRGTSMYIIKWTIPMRDSASSTVRGNVRKGVGVVDHAL